MAVSVCEKAEFVMFNLLTSNACIYYVHRAGKQFFMVLCKQMLTTSSICLQNSHFAAVYNPVYCLLVS